MSIEEILHSLRRLDATLSLDEGQGLRIQAPKGALSPELRDQLRSQKSALVKWLQDQDSGDADALPVCRPDAQGLHKPFPMADLQLGFYMANDPFMEFHVRPHYYNEKDLVELDLERYQAAWNKALARHRKEVVVVDADGMLRTLRGVPNLPIAETDLRGLPLDEALAALETLRTQMMRSELPIDRWPWLDVRVSRWMCGTEERVRIHFNHNNFFSDGFGTTRLLEEVNRFYEAPHLVLPEISLSFRDATLMLAEIAVSPLGKVAQDYWEQRLPDLPGAVALPVLPEVNKRCRSKLQRREGFLSASCWSDLKRRAQQVGITPSGVVFAAYAHVLSVWSNSEHFLLSNMMTRRLNIHPEIRDIVGNFASLYPLEIDLRGKSTFRDRALAIQEQVMRDARHVHWGGMQVMQSLNRLNGAVGTAAIPFVVGSGLFMEGFERSDFSCLETSQVMLDHQFWQLADGQLYFVWDVLEEFFPARMIDDMWRAYDVVLNALAQEDSAWDGLLPDLLPSWQRDERLQSWPLAKYMSQTRLCDLLPQAAEQHPDAVAVIEDGTTYSYADLWAQAKALALALTQVGVVVGDRVPVLLDRGLAWLVGVHAIGMVGAVYVPIEPSIPQERYRRILTDCASLVVVTSQRYLDQCRQDGVKVLLSPAPAQQSVDLELPARSFSEKAAAYIIYTSGSTGTPKGVMVAHGPALNTVSDINRRFDIGANDRIYGVSAIGFDLSVYDVFGAAQAGACVVYPSAHQSLNPAHWVAQMLASKVTIWNSAPPLAALMVDFAAGQGLTLPDLRLVMLSGDWIPLDLPDRIRAIAPNARVVSLGGATEAAIWSILYEIGDIQPHWRSIPYGYPMTNQTWHVLNREGQDVPVWVAGELYIGGYGLAEGYWGDVAKTDAAFIKRPGTGERIYRTGDIGRYLPGGLIEFLGRRDAQVKVQGHRIELGEIESALRAHPCVSDAAVVVQPGMAGAPELAAHVVLGAHASISVEGLREHLRAQLPRYMVPRLVSFLPTLPLSRNGKVDRKALPAIATPLPESVAHASRPPETEVELRLVGLWQKVLRLEHIGVHDDFFDIGGQSFEAVKLVGLVKSTLGVALSLGDIWENRTVAKLAVRLAEQGSRLPGMLRSLSTTAHGQPLFLVHPAGGQVVGYRHLASLLNCPVFGFEAPHPSDLGEAASIELIAGMYAQALIEQCPNGPIWLGGWSSGAPIAFELAHQLSKSGRTIQGVVVIDSPAPHPMEQVSEQQLLGWFAEDLELGDLSLCLAESGLAPGLDSAGQLDLLAATVQSIGRSLPASPDQLVSVYETFVAMVCANRVYRAPMQQVDVLVLRASQGQVSEFAQHPHAEEPSWGWSRLTDGHTEACDVEGTHQSLLTQPAVAVCAQKINDWVGVKSGGLGHAA